MDEERLLTWADARGYRVAWGPMSAVRQAGDEIESRLEAGEIGRAFAAANYEFDIERALADPRRHRLVVVAVPRPAHEVSFAIDGRLVPAVVPPTYQRYRPTFGDIRKDLAANGLPGREIAQIDAPLKLLASRLGLVRYGRNNITYAGPVGSYMQLAGYATDADLPVAPDWQPTEPQLLDQCAKCRACERRCPTGAISASRVLLDVERCLTAVNEKGGEWPPWIPASAHECLLGCLRCQRVCPANPKLPIETTGIVFTEQETGALLAGGAREGPAWEGIRAKLLALGQPYAEDAVGRNLRALLAAQGSAGGAS